ncbi:glutamine amidotransferase [Sutcliffiella horikoshii]|uniref:Glutamine amidotransferase n=1 Tax=Sutcliffiella horikoshii TaxID=79883 RepID=A0AA94WRU7_9BACI|nr:type 1 glutamine amidotransferase family protein [Sutcliffiella horikoshii]TYS59881.1 glutamine amidotransferase [Sutcliffiella horikoshii]
MQTKSAYLYAFHTMSDWEYSYLIAELNTGRYFKKDFPPLNIVTIGTTKETITTMGGLKITPDLSFDQCSFKKGDLIILPGGLTWGETAQHPILQKIGEALETGTIVAAICGATEALANLGYLDNRKHTGNNLDYLKMVCPTYKGEKFYDTEQPATSSDNLITASGIAPLEFAREVLKKLEVLSPETLNAWYQLNKTQKPEHYFELVNQG